ncbi:MAG TPA: anti-sigma factor antagonist [Limnochordia bacterium]|nr:anti-sigma factor antagonist [Limnochordia bacterium]
MQIKAERLSDTLIVRMKGELDLHTAADFKAEVDRHFERSARLRHVVLVMNEVDFVDSSGIGAILGRYKKLLGHGGRMVLAGLAPNVKKAFSFSGVDRVVQIVPDEDGALELVR